MRLLLALPLGLLIGAALGSLGGGGSILTVPALVYGLGLGAKPAVTTSLVVVGATALGGMLGHLKAGRVRVGPGILFGVAGVAGSLLGSRLNGAVDPNVLLAAFSGVMVLAAWRMWASARRPASTRAPARHMVEVTPSAAAAAAFPSGACDPTDATRRVPSSKLRLVVAFLAAGTVVGFMTGFFGVGGGFVIVPALVLVLRFDMPVAVGTSLLVIAINSATALATRLDTSGVDWKVAVPFTLAGLVGALVGNRVAGRLPTTTLVRWFAALLVAVAVYTLVHSLAG